MRTGTINTLKQKQDYLTHFRYPQPCCIVPIGRYSICAAISLCIFIDQLMVLNLLS